LFKITQHEKDEVLLTAMKEYFNCGYCYVFFFTKNVYNVIYNIYVNKKKKKETRKQENTIGLKLQNFRPLGPCGVMLIK
jgi:capsular polysaccharide biosynthesis protein